MNEHKNIFDIIYKLLEIMAKLGLVVLLIAAACLVLLFFFGGDDDAANIGRAEWALKDTGLGAMTDAARVSSTLHYSTYFRDGDEMTIFKINLYDEEEAWLWALIAAAPGWTQAPITPEEYAQLARKEFFEPKGIAAPAPDVVFDAWFYRDDYFEQYGEHAGFARQYQGLPEAFGLNGTPDTLNATFAFYDRESGAFFYYSYDT